MHVAKLYRDVVYARVNGAQGIAGVGRLYVKLLLHDSVLLLKV